MKHILASIGLCAGMALATTAAYAGSWQLVPAESKIAFGSIKKDVAGETHHFGTLSGGVSDTGDVSVVIGLASVETWIDVRNERMIEHVFGNASAATISVSVDSAMLEAMAPGATTVVSAKGTINFLGQDLPVESDMFVARLTDDKVLVTTDEMIMFSTEELGIDAGVDKLMELAKLPGITRVTPVTMRMVFQK